MHGHFKCLGAGRALGCLGASARLLPCNQHHLCLWPTVLAILHPLSLKDPTFSLTLNSIAMLSFPGVISQGSTAYLTYKQLIPNISQLNPQSPAQPHPQAFPHPRLPAEARSTTSAHLPNAETWGLELPSLLWARPTSSTPRTCLWCSSLPLPLLPPLRSKLPRYGFKCVP